MNLFSIIIPTFNSSKTLKACISSILMQSSESYEILIIDGQSTDDTLAIARSFKKSFIKIYSENDSGIYDAMNKGVTMSTGQWLFFLGSDDRLYDEKVLSTVSAVFLKTQRKIVYGNVLIDGHTIWAHDQQVYDGPFNLKKLLNKNICHQAIFYNRLLFNTYSFNTEYRICADYDLNLKLFAKYHFQYIDQIISIFNGGGESTVSSDPAFNRSETIIDTFYKTLYKNEFQSFKNQIRKKALATTNVFKKIYLNGVYLKHKILSA